MRSKVYSLECPTTSARGSLCSPRGASPRVTGESQSQTAEGSSERMVVLAPTGRDAELLGEVISHAALQTEVSPDINALCRELRSGAAVAVIAEEALTGTAASQLNQLLAEQPSWSDLPIIVLLTSGAT